MAFEEIKKDLAEVEADVRSYLENSEEYLKLKVFKVIMGMVTLASQIVLMVIIALLALIILSFAASYAIGKALNDDYLGFVIVGGFYVLIGIICYVFRNRLNKPLIKKFSKRYFD